MTGFEMAAIIAAVGTVVRAAIALVELILQRPEILRAASDYLERSRR